MAAPMCPSTTAGAVCQPRPAVLVRLAVAGSFAGAMAELLQHEIDHLDGILAVDRATGLDPFAYRSEWEKRHELSDRYGSPRPRELA